MDREHIRRLRQIADEARQATNPDAGSYFGLNIDGLRTALRKAADDIDKIVREAI